MRRLADRCTVRVHRTFDADARRGGAIGPAAAGAIGIRLASRGAAMRLEGTNLPGRALQTALALDAKVNVEIADRRRVATIRARHAPRAHPCDGVAGTRRAVPIGNALYTGLHDRVAPGAIRRAVGVRCTGWSTRIQLLSGVPCGR